MNLQALLEQSPFKRIVIAVDLCGQNMDVDCQKRVEIITQNFPNSKFVLHVFKKTADFVEYLVRRSKDMSPFLRSSLLAVDLTVIMNNAKVWIDVAHMN